LVQLREIEADLLSLGFQILAVSADRPEKLTVAARERELGYTLLSDSRMEASRAFGLAYRVAEEVVEAYRGYGIDLQDASGEHHGLLPVPAVYVVTSEGGILFQYANPDHRVRLEPGILMAAARAAVRGR